MIKLHDRGTYFTFTDKGRSTVRIMVRYAFGGVAHEAS